MSSKSNYKFLLLFSVLFLLLNCNRSEYTKLVKKEMSTGVVNDSLLFDMWFGDKKQDFFDKCWKLNNKGIIMQGPKNEFVQYDLPMAKKDSLKPKITMLFYGIFNSDRIMTGMKMKFYYEAWSLWHESLQSDKLVEVVKDTLKTWYPGNDFIQVTTKKKKKKLLVKVDGNRQIIIEPITDAKEVDVKIEDLRKILN